MEEVGEVVTLGDGTLLGFQRLKYLLALVIDSRCPNFHQPVHARLGDIHREVPS